MLIFGPTAAVSAQSPAPAQAPSVSVRPSDTTASDPNLGGWFVFSLAPGQKASARARITNPAAIALHVSLFFADDRFDDKGREAVVEKPTDVGSWGRFPQTELVLAPGQTVDVLFEITAPPTAEPGDHIGFLVARSDPQSSGGVLNVVSQVATHLYVTIPGDVTKSFQIISIKKELDSLFWPGSALVRINLRNTGRIRVHPKVTAGSSHAEGSDTLLSRSVESYVATVGVPWYGAFRKLPIAARAEGGLVRKANASLVAIPWGLLAILVLVAVLAFFGYRLWQKRLSRMESLRSDIRRLEQLVAQRPLGADSAQPPPTDDEATAETDAILAGLKRAGRTGNKDGYEVLALALHHAGGDALDQLLESLKAPSDERRDALLDAAVSYGAVALATMVHVRLSPEIAQEITARLDAENAAPTPALPAAGPVRKPRPRSPAKSKAKTPAAPAPKRNPASKSNAKAVSKPVRKTKNTAERAPKGKAGSSSDSKRRKGTQRKIKKPD